MSSIIGILGFKNAGKDTIGNILVEEYGFTKASFAGPLKDIVSIIFGWDRQLLEGDTEESRRWRELPDIWWEEKLNWSSHVGSEISKRFTPRFALQYFGTEVLRIGFHDDLWLFCMEKNLVNLNKVVITDCRFPNELNLIKSRGGSLLRVRREPDPAWFEKALNYNKNPFKNNGLQNDLNKLGIHPSEYSWIGYPVDFIIENNGTSDDLRERVLCLMNSSI